MKVYVYVDYREDKETGEVQFETPQVYAEEEKALVKWCNETNWIMEELGCEEDVDEDSEEIIEMMPGYDDHYFHLNTDQRLVTIYVKEVEVL